MTANAGVVLVVQLLQQLGVLKETSPERSQGWLDGQMILSVVLMNLLGFNRVSDAEKLESDCGLRRLVSQCERALFGLFPKQLAARFRGGRDRVFPSPRSIRNWLDRFHDTEAGQERIKGEAIIPKPAPQLLELNRITGALVDSMVRDKGLTALTLDIDATLIPSHKREAQPTYRSATGAQPGEHGYQPLNVYCSELGLMLCSEMRDGNVPAGMDNLRVLVDALKRLPPEIRTVRVRSDSAGHDNGLIAYCNTPQCRPEADNTRRFGTIHFVISARMSQDLGDAMRAMPETDWRALDCAEEAQADMTARLADGDGATLAVARYCGEVPFVSNANAAQHRQAVVRYVGTLRPLPEGSLGVGHNERPPGEGLPACRMHAYVTNYPAPGDPAAGGTPAPSIPAGQPALRPVGSDPRHAQERPGRRHHAVGPVRGQCGVVAVVHHYRQPAGMDNGSAWRQVALGPHEAVAGVLVDPAGPGLPQWPAYRPQARPGRRRLA